MSTTKRRVMARTMHIDIPPESLAHPRSNRTVSVKRIQVRRKGQAATAEKTTGNGIATPALQELFQNVYDAGLITDLDGYIIDGNVRAVEFFQYRREQFPGHFIGEIVIGVNEEIVATIRDNLNKNQFTLIQGGCRRKDGSKLASEISTSWLHINDQDYLCFLIRDITARQEAEDALIRTRDDLATEVQQRTQVNAELHEAIARLEQHNQAKSEFISNVSHEFRTPLTSIRYVAGNMRRGIAGPVTGQAEGYLNMILKDCNRLANTVEDILDLSRIDNNSLDMERTRAPFSRIIARTVSALAIQAREQGLQLASRTPAGTGFIDGDVRKLERVVLNLVKNAIKFTPAGGVVQVDLSCPEDYPEFLLLEVRDTGMGIPPEHLDRVTERYYRVGNYVSGTGLGLAITKEIVDRHGGSLHILSPGPGASQGTAVYVYLPRASVPVLRVLGEQPEDVHHLDQTLAREGYQVFRHAPPAAAALPTLTKTPPDALLLEWTSATMEPAVLLTQLQAVRAAQPFPVLALTEQNPAVAKRELLEGLNLNVLECPLHEDDLLDAMERSLRIAPASVTMEP